MRSEIAKRRLKDVLQVDSINSTQGDFLATHVPFRKMTVEYLQEGKIREISEEEIFQDYFDNSSMKDRHQLIIVKGSNGAGKSHFIRWLHAKLLQRDDPDEVVLLIRRSDNSLKGTIKQLLEIKEVRQLQNRELYKRLLQADQAVSEKKLKNQIYHQFLAEIQSDQSFYYHDRLYALLSNLHFEQHMMKDGGAIERIFRKVSSFDSEDNRDTVALFEPEDFVITVDFAEQMRDAGADRTARRMADKLILDGHGSLKLAKEVADYMNGHVETVIQNCAGIKSDDFEQIFEEIRQTLYQQGKRLTLLIEDITSFTGVNQALLNVLVTEHKGLNHQAQICRLASVVGTTTEYYKQFRSNYTDRVTEITIQDGAIGDTELALFVGKYLNVMSLEPEVIEEWLKNGAREEDYPVHQETEGAHWEHLAYKEKQLSLYPFTSAAIRKLYNQMKFSRTPRYILRYIVEPAVNDILHHLFKQKGFPRFCRNVRTGLAERVDTRIHNLVNQLPVPEEQKQNYYSRVSCLIGIWGDGTLDSSENRLGGLPLELYRELGLEQFAESVYGQTMAAHTASSEADAPNMQAQTPANSEPSAVQNPKSDKRKKDYAEFYELASKWHYDNGIFVEKLLPVRDMICEYAFASINWQQEGVSLRTVRYVRGSKKNLIGFVNQNRGKDLILMTLENTEEHFQLLLAFGKWLYLGKKSWDFEGSETAVYHVTCWLMKYKHQLVQAVHGQEKLPLYLKCAMMTELYRRILNGEYTCQTLDELDTAFWMRKPADWNQEGHSAAWQQVLKFLYSDPKLTEVRYPLTVQYFNLIQGANETSQKLILNYPAFSEALLQIRSSGMVLTAQEAEQKDEIVSREELILSLKRLLPKLDTAAKKEAEEAKVLFQELLDLFEFDETDEIEESDIRYILNEVDHFYDEAFRCGVSLSFHREELTRFSNNASVLEAAIAALQNNLTEYSTLEILLHFAGDPIGTVRPFRNLLRKAEQDIRKTLSQKQNEAQLAGVNSVSQNTDSRFVKAQSEFDELFKQFTEVTGG